MSNQENTQLQQAILAVQTGNLQRARQILATLLRQNPENARAWLWLGKAMDNPRKRAECFRRVLRIEPENDEARAGLVALRSGPEMPASAEEAPTRIQAYPLRCPQCGGEVRYQVSAQALRCAHCGNRRDLPARPVTDWAALPQDLAIQEAQAEPTGERALRCRSCGATTVLSVRAASPTCPFCGSPQVVPTRSTAPLIPPQAIVPFRLERAQAEKALREWLARGWLRPAGLADRTEMVDLHGLYLPFWGFKGLAEVSYRAQLSAPATLPAVFSQKQYIPVSQVLLPATYGLEEKAFQAIEPFDLDEAVAFHPEYLAGWPAEVYQIALADASIQAREQMSHQARALAEEWAPQTSDAAASILQESFFGGGSGRNSRSDESPYRPHFWTIRLDSFLHFLLPVWVGSYRYRGKIYRVAINGQTGRVEGETPRSVAMLGLSIALGAAVLALLAGLVVRLRPLLENLQPQEMEESSPVSLFLPYLLGLAFALVLFLLLRRPRVRDRLRKADREEGPEDGTA